MLSIIKSVNVAIITVILIALNVVGGHFRPQNRVTHPDGLYTVQYYVENPFEMHYQRSDNVSMIYWLNPSIVPKNFNSNQSDAKLTYHFKTVTIVPNFPILTIKGNTQAKYSFEYPELSADVGHSINIVLEATYIGHSSLVLYAVSFEGRGIAETISLRPDRSTNLVVKIKQDEGVWGRVFVVSVSVLLLISYITLGGQLNEDEMKNIMKNPKTLILGLLICIFVMPIISWFVAKWLLADQMIYRVGSFVFAIGPTATASTLWTVMMGMDKELSVGLQIVSNLAGLITMPLFLIILEGAIEEEGSEYIISVPYMRLIYVLAFIIMALLIGRYTIGNNKKAQALTARIFKPMTFAILIYIIVFSSILYWHIYTMFSWIITLTSLIITISTGIVSALLAKLINCSLESSFAIAIGSTYKNSGIAFAVLLVAFGKPDMYIAYVPCLTQILITSLLLYTSYIIIAIVNKVRRRGQPKVIQAEATSGDVEAPPPVAEPAVSEELSTEQQTESKPSPLPDKFTFDE